MANLQASSENVMISRKMSLIFLDTCTDVPDVTAGLIRTSQALATLSLDLVTGSLRRHLTPRNPAFTNNRQVLRSTRGGQPNSRRLARSKGSLKAPSHGRKQGKHSRTATPAMRTSAVQI